MKKKTKFRKRSEAQKEKDRSEYKAKHSKAVETLVSICQEIGGIHYIETLTHVACAMRDAEPVQIRRLLRGVFGKESPNAQA